MKDYKTYKSSWYEFTPGWSGFQLAYYIAGYFDSKPMLQIYFIWGKLFLYLPWRHYKKVKKEKTSQEIRKDKLEVLNNKKYKPKPIYVKERYNTSETPKYSMYFYMNEFYICYGRKSKSFELPWSLNWIKTSELGKNGEWYHETKNNRMEFWDKDKWEDKLFIETYPYKYTTNMGVIQECLATIKVKEREWRWHWFTWLKWTSKIRKDIEIEFSQDIGEKKGSYKGGITTYSYNMRPNESPYECLKRMENERRFE